MPRRRLTLATTPRRTTEHFVDIGHAEPIGDASAEHVSIHRIVREISSRLTDGNGWKRHASWLVSELGRSFGLARVYLYKNYPDHDDNLSAVRVAGWFDPLTEVATSRTDPRITWYDTSYFRIAREQLSSRQTFVPADELSRTEAERRDDQMRGDAAACTQILAVPVFVGDEWWGFLGAETLPVRRDDRDAWLEVLADAFWTIANLVGASANAAATQQALKWAEHLQRCQRDVALTISRGLGSEESLSELLGVICELGRFDSGLIELYWDGKLLPAARFASPPIESFDSWCRACVLDLRSHVDRFEPIYGDSETIAECRSDCALKASGTHSFAAIPIVDDETVDGVLVMFSSQRNRVPPSVRESIEAVATEIAIVISHLKADRLRRESDQRAAALTERLRLAIEAGQVGVWEYHDKSDRVRLSSTLVRRLGLGDESSAVPMSEVLSWLSAAEVKRIGKAFSHGDGARSQGESLEIAVSLPGRAPVWLSLRWRQAAADETGARLIGTAVDVTEFKRVEAELKQAQREAIASSAAKGEFLGKMSHEFRTPLNAILGSIQILRRDPALASLDRLQTIERSAHHLLSMVESILDQSRLEAGRLEIAPEPMDLAMFVASVAAQGRILAREHDLGFEVEIDGDLPHTVVLDGARLRQVLDNLVSNSAKYTESGRITLGVRSRGSSLRFAVRDTGRGISRAKIPDMFLPYHHDGAGSGAGLGLAIGREIVELMGSRLHVASREGEGTTFWFTVPVPVVIDRRPDGSIQEALRDESDEPNRVPDPDETSPALPDRDMLSRMQSAAEVGDVDALLELARDCKDEQPSSGDFCRRVSELAREFRVRAVRDLLDRATAATGKDE